MKLNQELFGLFLRLSLSAGFLSAVASRMGLWGRFSSGWNNFVQYTGQVNSFLPKSVIPSVAVMATICEALLGLLLLVGYKTSYAALAAGVLTLMFSLAMAWSSGIKEPLDYSVFAFSAGALLLSSMPHCKWSADYFLNF